MEIFERIAREPLPFAKLLGIEFVSAAADRIVGRMMVRDDLCTRPAVLHGGAIMAFADTLGAVGTIANLPEGAGTTTIESKTNFVAPAPVGTQIIGEATPIHRGKRTMIWQTRITNTEGRLVALVTQTQLILQGSSQIIADPLDLVEGTGRGDCQDLVKADLLDPLQSLAGLVGAAN
jgi:uncharacterized protein (TIGR00369 family)